MTENAFADRLEHLLRRTAVLPATPLPVERLAFELGALRDEPARLDAAVALLGDKITGGFLYRAHRELVIERLEQALPRLDAAGRFKIFTAALEMRPIDGEHLLRFVRFSLDALGLSAGQATAVRDGWSLEQKRIVYRWSNVLLSATALHVNEISALFSERGITGHGGHPWDVFSAFTGYRATVLLTPRMSPTVAHELKTMQREDWLDMPFMFGAAKSTFTIDEIEEDSSPQNMEDGRRIVFSLMRQRTPSTDYFAKTYAWHPRQTIERARHISRDRNIDIIEPFAFDREPRVLERHELGRAARALQAKAVRAMARVEAGTLPVDVNLSFHAGEAGEDAVIEFAVANSFKNDGKKIAVRATLGDADAMIAVLQENKHLLTAAGLPLLLAKLYSASSRVVFSCPDGPSAIVTADLVAVWDASASRQAGQRASSAKTAEPPAAVIGTWRGHSTQEHYPEPMPYTLELFLDPDGGLRALATTPDFGAMEMRGNVVDGRLALRQIEGGHYVIETAWDEAARTLEGGFRYSEMGGTLSLKLQAPPREASAEELLDEVVRPWQRHLRVDLDAVRFPRERELLHALFDDEHFRAAYLESQATRALGTQQLQLDNMVGRGATQLSRAMLPSAFRALDAAKTALGLSDDVRLWVHNDSSLNAFVTVDDGKIAVHFTSGLLETLLEVELQATIGHELGHVLFGSHDLAIRLQGTQMSGESRLRYLALRRVQELSADRLSLIACADPHAVFLTQTMLRTGIKKRELFGPVESLFENARAEVDKLRSRSREHVAHDSHPYTSLRTVALELFAQSSAFRALRPDAQIPGSRLDDARIAEQLTSLAELLAVPPSTPNRVAKAAPGEAVPRFLALAAMRLVEADQSIGVRELAALNRLHEQLSTHLREVLTWTHERRDVEMIALRKEVNQALSVPEREDLLDELLKVVRADNVVAYSEASIVAELGRLLELDTPSFRKTIDDLYRGAR